MSWFDKLTMTHAVFAPGKIILSGEYAVLFGHPGLAVPSTMGIHAIFAEDQSRGGVMLQWPELPDSWKTFAATIIAECAAIKGDALCGTLSIENQLPLGKGMGSSTALVSAITRALLGDDCEVQAKAIEDRMNPGHSGLDFAVIWHNQPVRFIRGQHPEFVTLPSDLLQGPELIDTGTPEQTTSQLVEWVKSREAELREPLQVIADCTDRLLSGESPLTVFPDHHRAQVVLGVVPSAVQDLIAEIERGGGAAKVIGAGGRTGGGGMALAFPGVKA